MKDPNLEPASAADEILSIVQVCEGRISAMGIKTRLIKFAETPVDEVISVLSDLADTGKIARHQEPGQRALYSKTDFQADSRESELAPSPASLPPPMAALKPPQRTVMSDTRGQILKLLRERPRTNGDLMKALGMSSQGVTSQTNKLKAAGLIHKKSLQSPWEIVEIEGGGRARFPSFSQPSARPRPAQGVSSMGAARNLQLLGARVLRTKSARRWMRSARVSCRSRSCL